MPLCFSPTLSSAVSFVNRDIFGDLSEKGFCASLFVRGATPSGSIEEDAAHFGVRVGGLELLCDSVKIHNVNVETPKGAQQLAMRDLLVWVQKNLIKERPEMFIKGDTVRPGVLVLVNDCDWELSGQLDTTLEEKDVVVFISTLHGG
ncbi:hypothetical protein EUGRSUZ_E01325 [Eucalyptus grandis]|uniref:Uncharacterized protein n=2 Tax=Eucalyptus grandis TaxID=71139 RepID=A0ACC3KUI0_EUCGR|nr:hypothetical protein EUGRSUZ_E01325 [Eucalyptus grandis]